MIKYLNLFKESRSSNADCVFSTTEDMKESSTMRQHIGPEKYSTTSSDRTVASSDEVKIFHEGTRQKGWMIGGRIVPVEIVGVEMVSTKVIRVGIILSEMIPFKITTPKIVTSKMILLKMVLIKVV